MKLIIFSTTYWANHKSLSTLPINISISLPTKVNQVGSQQYKMGVPCIRLGQAI
jgi:hypothetical protein